MDDWKNGVDRQLETLHDDVRKLLGALLGLALLGATLLAGLYFYIGSKSEDLERQVQSLQINQTRIEGELKTRDAVTNGKLDVLLERKGTGRPPRG